MAQTASRGLWAVRFLIRKSRIHWCSYKDVAKETKYFILRNLGVPLVTVLFKGIFRTVSVSSNNPVLLRELSNAPEGAIFAFWHCDLIMIAHVGRRLGFTHKDTYFLSSTSRDGELLSRVTEHFGVKSVKGSSTRAGARGLLELKDKVMNGANVAIAVDGPLGPRFKAKSGVILLAKVTGVPVYPVAFHLSRKIVLHSWDKTEVPRPFSRCHVTLGKPIHIPSTLSPQEIEAHTDSLEKILADLKLHQQCDSR